MTKFDNFKLNFPSCLPPIPRFVINVSQKLHTPRQKMKNNQIIPFCFLL